MTNLELLDILGSVQGKYILQAQEMRAGSRKVRRFPYGRRIAAGLALVLMLTLFLNTAPGAAAMEFVKEKVASLIETLFPPKKMSINIEGFEVEGDYVADGVEPETVGETPKPGFAIYYDVDSYTMVKEGDVTYIRPNPDYQPDGSLPPCEIEITHLDLPYAQAASRERAELEGKWEIQEFTKENRITFSMLGGHEWNSPVEDRDYISDEQGGCFRIISRYFLEAAEGHGTRFAAMVRTFTLLADENVGQPTAQVENAMTDENKLQEVLRNRMPFYSMDSGATRTLAEYCAGESDRLGFAVSITRYALVDMDGDGVQEAVVDFQFGENAQVMCMVLKNDNGTVFGAEFYHRQMSNIKENGIFAYSGGGDNDGWGRLRWKNGTWETEILGIGDYGEREPDVRWYAYPIEEGESQ